jgi:hypothetical protein
MRCAARGPILSKKQKARGFAFDADRGFAFDGVGRPAP